MDLFPAVITDFSGASSATASPTATPSTVPYGTSGNFNATTDASGVTTIGPTAAGAAMLASDNQGFFANGAALFKTLGDFFSGKTVAGYGSRGFLIVIGLIFLIFGFIMLAMRSGNVVANSEAGRAVARLAA